MIPTNIIMLTEDDYNQLAETIHMVSQMLKNIRRDFI